MSLHITEEVKEIINDKETVAVISAVGKNGNPFSEVSKKLTIWKDERIAYYELLESSQLQKNLVYSLWFDKEIIISLIGKNGKNYSVIGKPYQALIAGHEFEAEYIEAQEEFGERTDLSTVWLIDVISITEDTYEVAKTKEEREHPYLMHMDHIYKEASSNE